MAASLHKVSTVLISQDIPGLLHQWGMVFITTISGYTPAYAELNLKSGMNREQ
jgi:hypothetical protein